MKHQNTLVFLLAFVGFTSTVDAANLLTNSNFDASLAGWTISSTDPAATATYDGSTGSPANGSAVMFTPSGATSVVTLSQCVAIGAQNIDFFGREVVNNNTGPANPIFRIQAFNAPGCTGTQLISQNTNFAVYPSPYQEHQLNNFALPAGTQSVLVSASLDHGGNYNVIAQYHFDHILFGPAGTTPVTLQSFDVE